MTPFIRAYYESFQDWRFWLDSGLVDFVTIMDYCADTSQFRRFLKDARNRVKRRERLFIGVGAYKLVREPETFERQFRLAENAGCGPAAVFHYGSLRENKKLADVLLARRSYNEIAEK